MIGDVEDGYNHEVENFRDAEYPMTIGKTYLDHGGTTLYAKSVVERFSADLILNLYGNPHSCSTPSTLSSQKIASVRERALRFFNADPKHFDLVFTANATAAIKLVMDSFRDLATTGTPEGNFWYGYHRDAHTSVVGVREVTKENHRCFLSDEEVEQWLEGNEIVNGPGRPAASRQTMGLFAYPGQSNMTGRRLPLNWCGRLRNSPKGDHIYSLLDAAALVTTSPLDLSNPSTAPDFTVLSFYKIFGFPDLGALIVRKDSGHILQWRHYFGGGTVDMVLCVRDTWHARKDYANDPHYELHDQLEDGTPPFHSIIALGVALDVHAQLYRSMARISAHTACLAQELYDGLSALTHVNGLPICRIYKESSATYGDPLTQGATLAFNVQDETGVLIPYSDVEHLADAQHIYVRSGGLCNPGGIATHLQLAPWEMKRMYSSGHRCGHVTEIIAGKATGVVRASLGAMSTRGDVERLLKFLKDTFSTDKTCEQKVPSTTLLQQKPTVEVINTDLDHFISKNSSTTPSTSVSHESTWHRRNSHSTGGTTPASGHFRPEITETLDALPIDTTMSQYAGKDGGATTVGRLARPSLGRRFISSCRRQKSQATGGGSLRCT